MAAKRRRETTLPRPFLCFVQSEELMNSPVYLTQLGLGWESYVCVFLGSKITADGECRHEIKRHLLLRRKAMTN